MTIQSSTPSNGEPMTHTKMNLETFIAMFDSESDAIEHILDAHNHDRVETTEYTIPYYTFARCLETPRFIAYGDHAPQLYSYEVRINLNFTGVHPTSVTIEFPMSDWDAIDWFTKHLSNRLSDGWGEFETEEVNITDEYELERTALDIQLAVNLARMRNTRKFLQDTSPKYITDAQFDQNCHYITHTTEENKAIRERIEYLDQFYFDQLA